MKRENEHRVVAKRQERHVDFCRYAVSKSKVKQGTKGKERKNIDDYIAVSPSSYLLSHIFLAIYGTGKYYFLLYE